MALLSDPASVNPGDVVVHSKELDVCTGHYAVLYMKDGKHPNHAWAGVISSYRHAGEDALVNMQFDIDPKHMYRWDDRGDHLSARWQPWAENEALQCARWGPYIGAFALKIHHKAFGVFFRVILPSGDTLVIWPADHSPMSLIDEHYDGLS